MGHVEKTGWAPGMAPCGIICGDCDIFQAAQDPAEAVRLAEGWRAAGFQEAVPEWFRCRGCRADRALCWTDDCGIYACCVEERGLDNCAQCADFPCQPYTEWAAQGAHHADAAERLRLMR